MLPNKQQIKALHRKYAKTNAAYNLIYTHCRIIENIAMQLLERKPGFAINHQLVQVGCLLHDIGAYQVLNEEGRFTHGVRHGVIGEKILKDEGFPDIICRFASHHTGVGLTKQDVIDQNLPIPADDYTPDSEEERLITYADKFHSKSKPPIEPPYFCTFELSRNDISKFGEEMAAKFDALAETFGKPDLKQLSLRYGYEIRDIDD